jgi:HEAT repeat protein
MTSTRRKRMLRHIENLGNSDKAAACRAESYLIRSYLPDLFDNVLPLCDSPDPQTRFRAVWILGKTGDHRAHGVILRLTDDPDERVRYDATIALGILNDDRAMEPLLAILALDDETRPAGIALSRMGPSIAPRLDVALRSADQNARVTAVNVLGGFADTYRDPTSIAILTSLLADEDEYIRGEAKWWLEEGFADRD